MAALRLFAAVWRLPGTVIGEGGSLAKATAETERQSKVRRDREKRGRQRGQEVGMEIERGNRGSSKRAKTVRRQQLLVCSLRSASRYDHSAVWITRVL